jgi:Uma2 family endonuclease
MSSSAQTPLPRPATFQDLLAIPEEDRFHEILDGELVPKEAATIRHALSQRRVGGCLDGFDGRPNGPSRPGGWWIVSEVTIKLSAHQTVRPDVAGWRRERLPELPSVYPIEFRPDWVCEVGSDSNSRRRDGLQKRRIYADYGIPHYWLVQLDSQRLTVLRLVHGVYQEILDVGPGDRVRAEPFDGVEIQVSFLFGEDPQPVR